MQHLITLTPNELTVLLKEVVLKKYPNLEPASVSFNLTYSDDRSGASHQIFSGATITCNSKAVLSA